MTAVQLATPEKKGQTVRCPKCNSAFSRTEEDAVGMIRSCTRCGHCTYLDKKGNIIEGEKKLNTTAENRLGNANAAADPSAAPPGAEASSLEATGVEAPGVEAPGVEAFSMENPGVENPGAEVPSEEAPGVEVPSEEAPGVEVPSEEAPGVEAPGEENPSMEAPGVENPSMEVPGAEVQGGTSGLDITEVMDIQMDDSNDKCLEEKKEETGCPNCGSVQNELEDKRFRRMPLTQCPDCRHWKTNPAHQGDLGTRERAIAAALQINMEGTPSRKLCEEMEILTDQVKATPANVAWWLPRYSKPATEAMGRLGTPTASRTWEIDTIPIRTRRTQWWYWSIIDQMTQYILATGRTETKRIDSSMLREAEWVSGERPTRILLGHPVPEDIQGLESYASKDCDILKYSGKEENPDSSMIRFRNAVKQKLDGSPGNTTIESIDHALNMLAISINLFEECPETGTTPAENAGIKSPYADLSNLVEIETNNPPSREARKRDSVAPNEEAGTDQDQAQDGIQKEDTPGAGQGQAVTPGPAVREATQTAANEVKTAEETPPESAQEVETGAEAESAQEVEAEAESAQEVEAGAETAQMVETGAETAQMVETGAETAQVVETGAEIAQVVETGAEIAQVVETGAEIAQVVETGAEIAQVVETGAEASTSQENDARTADPHPVERTGDITLRELLERLSLQEEEAYRKYLEVNQAKKQIEEVIQFLELEEPQPAAA